MRSTVLTFLLFASAPLATTGLATNHQHRHLHSLRRTVSAPDSVFGWSMQSATCPTDTNECSNGGYGACCPQGTFCNPAGNLEVAACCPTAADCRGLVQSASRCADSSWSLWQGKDGNKFCCEAGMTGITESESVIAGRCVSPSHVGSATIAKVISTASTSSPSSADVVAPQAASSTDVAVITVTVSPIEAVSTAEAVPETEISSNTTEAPAPSAIPTSASPTTFATSASSVTPAHTTSAVSTTSAAPIASVGSSGKPVFFHYMVGGINDNHVEQDIKDAKALGVDAFALNINCLESWATDVVKLLFKHAETHDFKLFFSFDMTGFTDPTQFLPFLKSYVTNSAHFKYNGLPFVSTFNGGASSFTFGQATVNDGWKVKLSEAMSSAGNPVFFVPSFQDAQCTEDFFSKKFPALDGAFNWDSWPHEAAGNAKVSKTDDTTYITGARSSKKTFMMGISPLQFKHMDNVNNWYRRGAGNLEHRLSQVLDLQPDFIEFQTWNDAGEGHYMGNIWPEPSQSAPQIQGYTKNYDHSGYNQILPAFIAAYKAGSTTTSSMYPTNGKKAQGTFWNHALLKDADCSADPLGKPKGVENVEDIVAAIILVAQGVTTYTATVTVDGKPLGEVQKLVSGYNAISVEGLTAGKVAVTVQDSASGTKIISGTGPNAVAGSSSLCNYNLQVVGLA